MTIRPLKTRLYQGFYRLFLGRAVSFYGLPRIGFNAVNIFMAELRDTLSQSPRFLEGGIMDKNQGYSILKAVQTEAPGLYKYYSTQRPVDIGTFPKPPHNAPDEIVNYDQRIPVEGGAFLAWGHLTYTRPLTERQTADYELRPAPDNPDRPRPITQQIKEAAKLAGADRGDPVHKKKAPAREER